MPGVRAKRGPGGRSLERRRKRFRGNAPLTSTWRLPRGIAGRGGLLIAGFVACWLAVQIAVGAVSDYFAISKPDLALAWNPDHAEALAEAAERRFESAAAAEKQGALGLARQAMIESPLIASPLRLLALKAEEEGDEARARRMMQMAAQRSPRDLKAQIWLADEALLAGDFSLGLERIDALLRIWPALGETLFPALARMTTEAAASDALLASLRDSPPWRKSLFARMPSVVEPPGQMAPFYLKAMAGAAPVTNEELRPYLRKLIGDGKYELAHSIWVASLPETRRRDTEAVTNGEFDFPITGTGFDWRIDRVRGVNVGVVSDQSRGKILKIAFHNTRVAFRHVSQVLLLEPGSYRLVGWSKANRLLNARGLQWTIRCASKDRTFLGGNERLRGTYPWAEFSFSFEVPAGTECGAQELRLELPARIGAEEEVAGEIWFDSIRIEGDALGQL
jgi:hypothetical protein